MELNHCEIVGIQAIVKLKSLNLHLLSLEYMNESMTSSTTYRGNAVIFGALIFLASQVFFRHSNYNHGYVCRLGHIYFS